MDFDINKCSTLHIGIHNTGNRYTPDRFDIGKSNSEKDLGLLVSQNLRPREQCISARNRVNRIIGFITMLELCASLPVGFSEFLIFTLSGNFCN